MERQKVENGITEGVIWKQLALFFFPILFGAFFQQLYNMADAVIVGRFAGKEALAAVEVTGSMVRLPVSLFVGLASGSAIAVSQYYGAKKFDEVSKAANTAVVFAVAGGAVVSVLGILLAPVCLRWMGVPPELSPAANDYARIFFAGMIPSMIYNMGTGILRAVGDSRKPFYFLVASCLVNIVLDLLFVAGMGWSVRGVAVATVISQVLSAVLVLVELVRTAYPCKLQLRRDRLDRGALKEMLRMGLPVGLQSSMYPLSNILVQAGINRFGTNAIAAWGVCGKLDFLVWTVIETFGVAVATFVAQNYGAGRYDRVRASIRTGALMSVGSVLPLCAVLFLWGGAMSRLFVQDGGVVEYTTRIIRFLAPFYATSIGSEILGGAIRGTGETLRPMVLTMTFTCAVRIVWMLALVPLHPTLYMVLGCFPLTWILTSVCFILYYRWYTQKGSPMSFLRHACEEPRIERPSAR